MFNLNHHKALDRFCAEIYSMIINKCENMSDDDIEYVFAKINGKIASELSYWISQRGK